MINMFALCFAWIVLINIAVSGQNNDFDSFFQKGIAPGNFFGQLHHLIDQQQAPISCVRVRANIKNAHPLDNRKYFICRDEQRFDVFTCPKGGIFDDREKACIDLCEQHKPCLNQGQCIILANLTLQCVCRRDWTGERCEIPLSSCADNPCGPNNECRKLHANGYTQDYVCICDNEQSYGRNCQQTVPNPCLSSRQQFHPFAFSRHAYINCDDEWIFFQPCNSKLYWNQEDKRCDRELPLLLRAPFLNIRLRLQPIVPGQREPDIPTRPQDSNQEFNNRKPLNPQVTRPFEQLQESQNGPNFQLLLNRFLETTTTTTTTPAPPRVFRLQGFSSENFGQQNTGRFQSQSWQDQNQQFTTTDITPQLPQPIQRNNQFGFIQSQPNAPLQQSFSQNTDIARDLNNDFNNPNRFIQPSLSQRIPSSFETTTVASPVVPKGFSVHLLRGWQSDQQGTSNSVPTNQLRS